MKKARTYIVVILLVFSLTLLASYGIYKSGVTNKLKASLNKMTYKFDDEVLVGNYPKINLLINSSGEKLVNEDVSITVFASSNYVIDRLYFSYDLKNWKTFEKFKKGKSVKVKLTFKKNIKSKLYIRVENEKVYQSYSSKTSLNIDKKKPKLSIRKSHDHIIITASDNVSLDKVGYSVDGQNFDYEEIDKVKKSTFSKEYNDYRYVCIVDSAGNVSKIKKIISE